MLGKGVGSLGSVFGSGPGGLTPWLLLSIQNLVHSLDKLKIVCYNSIIHYCKKIISRGGNRQCLHFMQENVNALKFTVTM
jgi:hypothetical protein